MPMLMNKIQKSIILTGLIIIFSSIFIFFTPKNYIFAVEYETFRSDTYGIEFQYPSDWKVDENSRYDDERDIIDIYGPNEERMHIRDDLQGDEYNNLQTFTKEYLKLVTSNTAEYTYKIIEKPSPTDNGKLDMGTFLFTRQDKNEDSDEKVAIQFWTIILDKQRYASLAAGHQYAISFIAFTSQFDNPTNMEIRDHFIKSLKFRGDGKSPSPSTSRFD